MIQNISTAFFKRKKQKGKEDRQGELLENRNQLKGRQDKSHE